MKMNESMISSNHMVGVRIPCREWILLANNASKPRHQSVCETYPTVFGFGN
ncbi:hypothetical protein AB4582_08720 [Vibrio splendidus]